MDPEAQTYLRDLEVGQAFCFPNSCIVYTYRGNGWYGRPYDGGPWHDYGNPQVIAVDHRVRPETLPFPGESSCSW